MIRNLHVSPVRDEVGNQGSHQAPKPKVEVRTGSKHSLDLTWRRKALKKRDRNFEKRNSPSQCSIIQTYMTVPYARDMNAQRKTPENNSYLTFDHVPDGMLNESSDLLRRLDSLEQICWQCRKG